MAQTCTLCGSTRSPRPLYESYGIVRCDNCQLTYYNGSVVPADIYTDRYFKGDEYRNYEQDKISIQRNFLLRIEHLKRFCSGGRLLELGCAYGFFLDVARPTWDVTGIDITSDGIRHARERFGVDARCCDFLGAEDEAGSYDIACLWDTIEHLTDPLAVLRKVRHWLKPTGICVITTGDIGSAAAKLRGKSWRQIHPPSHVYYFSRATLSRALVSAGFEVVDSRYVGYSRQFQSMVHGLTGRTNRVSNILTVGGRVDFPIYLNLFDIMMMTARCA